MTSNTAEAVADEMRNAFTIRDGDVLETSWSYIRGVISDAVTLDRGRLPIVTIRDGEVFADEDTVQVENVNDILAAIESGEMSREDVDALIKSLNEQGWLAVAEDILDATQGKEQP